MSNDEPQTKTEQISEKEASELYWSAVEKGREVAIVSRYEGLNDPKLTELLPELTEKEVHVLGENIEQAIQSEVKRTLTQRERNVGDDDE